MRVVVVIHLAAISNDRDGDLNPAKRAGATLFPFSSELDDHLRRQEATLV